MYSVVYQVYICVLATQAPYLQHHTIISAAQKYLLLLFCQLLAVFLPRLTSRGTATTHSVKGIKYPSYANHCVSQSGYRFLFRSPSVAVELHTFVRGGEPPLRTRGIVVSRGVYMVRRPRGRYKVYAMLSLEAARSENKSIHIRCCHLKHVRLKIGS